MSGIGAISERHRSPAHRAFVRTLHCVVCNASPLSDPHHLKFAQPRAMSLKVSDEFCVPLCRRCHDAVESAGDEVAWWARQGIDPLPLAAELWEVSTQKRPEH